MSGYDAEQIKRYYENNTSRFLRFGQGGDGTIRRAVWGPGVSRRADAMAYVDDLILERVESLAVNLGRPPRVLDLGCGVGASLIRIGRRCEILGTGITISPLQVELARQRIERFGVAGSVTVFEGDYSHLPPDLKDFDLCFAIESFVHAPDAAQFFRSAFGALNDGGVLIVCDDFPSVDSDRVGESERRWLERYKNGWRANSLLGPSELTNTVEKAGFVPEASRDLTGFVELGRPRDYAIALLTRGLGWLPLEGTYWSMLKGGDALQRCLRRGWLRYLFCSFLRAESI
jgi:SAM-dependent methyltransferase